MSSGAYYDSALYDTALYDDAGAGVKIELLINAVWTDITGYVRVQQGIRITRGRQDEQSAFSGAQCSMTLDNRDGRFSPRYPSGAYFGFIGRNTQIRVKMYDATSATYLVRFHGVVSEWPVVFDPSFNEGTVSITADGIRRRLLRNSALGSPMFRAVSTLAAGDVIAYWPMEDGSVTTQFASGMSPPGSPASFTGSVELDGDTTTFVGSDGLPVFGDAFTFSAKVPNYLPSASGSQVVALFKSTATSSSTGFDLFVDTIGAHYFVFEYIPSTNLGGWAMYNYATGIQEAASTTFNMGAAFSAGCRIRWSFKQNGTGIDVDLSFDTLTGAGFHFGVVTIPASTFGWITGIRMQNNGAGVSTTLGHVYVENNVSGLSIGSAMTGWAGETAIARCSRVAGEEGIPIVTTDGLVTSAQMGLQPLAESALTIIDDAATVDGSISTELVDSFGLSVRSRSSMYSKPATVTLNMDKIREIQPTDDDQLTENDVTVTRSSGSSYRAVSIDAVMSPTALGTYASSYDLNLYSDTQLQDQAGWRMSEGTINKPRVPEIFFDANKLAATDRTNLFSLREGDTISLTATIAAMLNKYGLESPCSLRVVGWEETVTDVEWLFSLNAVQVEPFNVLILDDATYGVLETGLSPRIAL